MNLPCPVLNTPWQLLTLLLLLAVAPRPTAAQAPPWTRATLAQGGGSRVSVSATDAQGNVFVAGLFQGQVAFGATTLTADNLGDAFVAKWSPATSEFVWAQRIGGQDGDFATALAVRDSSVYVAGISNSGTTYAGSLSTHVVTTGGSGSFLAKLSDRGKSSAFVWLHGLQTVSDINALACVGPETLYAAGGFRAILRLDGKQVVRDDQFYSQGNMFVLKLADSGPDLTLTWVQQAGGQLAESASALAVVGSSVYVAGRFTSAQAFFGPLTLSNADQASTFPSADVFVTKLTDEGATSHFVWVQQAGGLGDEQVRALAVVGPTLYLGGTFTSPTSTFGPQTLVAAGSADGFVAKLTDAGAEAAFQWALRVGGAAADRLDGLVAAGSHLYVAGGFQGAATFGSAAFSATSQGSADIFVAQLVDAGGSARVDWVQTAGGPQEDNATTLALLPATRELYVAGTAGPAPHFGPLTPTSTAAYAAAFVAGLGPVEVGGTVPPPVAQAPTPAPAPAPPGVAILPPTLLAYPNPAHGTATVTLPAGPVGSPVGLLVFNMLGQVVGRASATLAATTTRTTLDLSGLAPGVYALRIAVGPDHTTTRLVVE